MRVYGLAMDMVSTCRSFGQVVYEDWDTDTRADIVGLINDTTAYAEQ